MQELIYHVNEKASKLAEDTRGGQCVLMNCLDVR